MTFPGKRLSLTRTIMVAMITMTILVISIIGYLWVSSSLDKFREQSESIRNNFFLSRKATLKKVVNEAFDYIRYQKSLTEKRLKKEIRDRTFEAWSIASYIYDKNKGNKEVSEIKQMVKDALRPIRFNNGLGYFFATELNGVEQLFADHPELEGKNLLHLQDTDGKYVIRDMIRIAKEQGEGYYRYMWSKPKSRGKNFSKIAFIKYFEPFDWFIGTGEYLDDIETNIQAEVLDRLVQIRFGDNGYLFGSTYSGEPLFTNGKITIGTKHIRNLTDPDGVNIFQRQRKAIEYPEGGFLKYRWIRLNDRNPSPKISFVRGFSEWEWIIGAGAYLDEIESEIAGKQAELDKKIGEDIRKIIFFLTGTLIVVLLLSGFLIKKIRTNIRQFIDYFSRASRETVFADEETFHFFEFTELAHSFNEMIEARSRAEEELRESEKKFLKIFHSSPVGLVITTAADGKCVEMNEKFSQMTGLTPASVKEHTSVDLKFWESTEAREKKVREMKDQGGLRDMELSFFDTSGKRHFGLFSSELIDIQGTQYIISSVNDITELKQMEDDKRNLEIQLRQSRKMEAIGTLAGGIAHEFNNILGIILGNAELAKDDIPDWNPAGQNMEKIIEACLRAKKVILQLLHFSRKTDMERKPVPLARVVEDSIKFISSSKPDNIQVNIDIKDTDEIVLADTLQIHQVLVNLCDNALYSMRETGGTLFVSLSSVFVDEEMAKGHSDLVPGKYFQLVVGDTGPGIEEKMVERVFDPYFTTKPFGQGAGMGLTAVHGIVRSHDGAVSVSSSPGKRTEFHVFFPIAEALEEAKSPPDADHEGGRILLIDDEIIVTDLLSIMLSRAGYSVHPENDPQKALEDFRRDPKKYDLVILDYVMPAISGEAVSMEMLKIRPDIPIVICSGYRDRFSENDLLKMGIREVIAKPPRKNDLLDCIRRVLRT